MWNRLMEYCGQHGISLRQYLATTGCYLSGEELLGYLPKDLHSLIKIDKTNVIDRYKFLKLAEGVNCSFVFVIASYNNENYVIRNLESVFSQNYLNYRVIYIDDCSEDDTYHLVERVVTRYGMWGRVKLCRHPVRNYGSGSRFSAYHLCDDDEILCMLDGDDWLANREVLIILNGLYREGAMSSYGSYRRLENGQLGRGVYGNEVFPLEILESRDFRHYRWTSGHFRTGYAGLFKRIKLLDMIDVENQFLRCCTDLAEMMPVLEMSSPNISRCNLVLYIYNKDASIMNSNSFYQIKNNPNQQLYRDYLDYKIKHTNKYPRISRDQLFRGRYQTISKLDYEIAIELEKLSSVVLFRLLQLLNITKLNYLTKGAKIDNPLFLYHKSIKIGNINLDSWKGIGITRRGKTIKNGDLVISLDNWEVDYTTSFFSKMAQILKGGELIGTVYSTFL